MVWWHSDWFSPKYIYDISQNSTEFTADRSVILAAILSLYTTEVTECKFAEVHHL